jgi:two-component system response regulator AtoC
MEGPMAPVEEAMGNERDGRPSRYAPGPRVVPRPCGELRILLLDDEEAFRVALAETLREDGHTVEAYGRPSEVTPAAIAAADLMITDYRMGLCELDGLSFADAVHAGRASLPIVLLTAHDSSVLERRVAARDGFVHLRQKPIEYDLVHALVHQLVPGREKRKEINKK